jgi:hypothetical protein
MMAEQADLIRVRRFISVTTRSETAETWKLPPPGAMAHRIPDLSKLLQSSVELPRTLPETRLFIDRNKGVDYRAKKILMFSYLDSSSRTPTGLSGCAFNGLLVPGRNIFKRPW